jgi:hypothetical protein
LLRPDPQKPGWGLTNPDDLRDPLQIGLTIVGVTAALGGLGWWLDSLLHTFPILMVIGAAAGMFGIIYLTYKRLQAFDDSKPRKPDDHSGPQGGA